MNVEKCEECKKARFKIIDKTKLVFCTLGSYKGYECHDNDYEHFEKGTVKIFYEYN